MLDGAGSDAEASFLTLVFSVPLGMLVAGAAWAGRGWLRQVPLSFYITTCTFQRR